MFVRYRQAVALGVAAIALTAVTGCAKKSAAVVNGKAIPSERFYEIMERSSGAPLLAQLISEELVLQEAEKQGVKPAQADIDRQYAEAKKNDPTLLGGMSEEEARRQITVSLAVKNLAFKGVTVPEEEAKKAFEENKAQFDQPESVTLKRAVFKTEEEAKIALGTLKKNVEFSVVMDKSIDYDQIRTGGGNLPALVRTQDASTPYVFMMANPGSGGPLPADALLGAGVAEKVFALKEKDLTEVLPCPAPKGFQIIQVQSHTQAKKGTYAEWKGTIEDHLKLQKRFANEKMPQGVDPMTYFRAQLVNKLRREAKIEVNLPRLKDVPTRQDVWPQLEGAGQ